MGAPAIIDIVAAAVLIGLTAFGAKRGLFRAVAGLLAAAIALAGAGLIASTLSAPAAKALAPAVERRLESRLDGALQERGQDHGGEVPLAEVLELLGVDETRREELTGRAEEIARQTGADLMTAAIESVARSVLYGALYTAAFVALTVVLYLLTRSLDALFQLPVLHGLNTWGGALAGLAEGALLLFLVVWVLRLLAVPLEGAGPLARFFLTHTPLDALKFLGI